MLRAMVMALGCTGHDQTPMITRASCDLLALRAAIIGQSSRWKVPNIVGAGPSLGEPPDGSRPRPGYHPSQVFSEGSNNDRCHVSCLGVARFRCAQREHFRI
jgi:hypothetical protein